MKFSSRSTFKKTDAARRLVYSEVYKPLTVDSQGDYMTAEGIEDAAHAFLKSGFVNRIDLEHDGKATGSSVIESFIASEHDKTFAPRSWVLGVQVPDANLWQQIVDGQLNGFSMYGEAEQENSMLNGKPAKLLKNAKVTAVSLVRKGANGEVFKVKKNDDPLADALANIAKAVEGISEMSKSVSESLSAFNAKIDALKQNPAGTVQKADPAPVDNDDITYELRRRARLQERLENLWEGGGSEAREVELRAALEKSADRLHALGHDAQAVTLDSNSAFFQRGGTSTFLVAGPSTAAEILTATGNRRDVRKDDDDINVENCLIL